MHKSTLSILTAALLFTGCATPQDSTPTTTQPASLDLPPAAAPDPALVPLTFMAGSWIAVNPNETINQEHWTIPRGNNMAAIFKQNRRDGKPALVEVSLITADKDEIRLTLRHLHAGLEVPERRKELSIFRLVSAGTNRAEFAGTGAAAKVTSVVYRLSAPDELTVEVAFAPDAGEKGYVTVYRRER